MRQIEGQEVYLPRHAADHRHRLAEVHLGMTRWMHQRNEHLPRPAPALADIVLNDRVAAGEPVLVSKPLEYLLRRVPLLAVRAPILFEDPVDDAREWIELRSPRRAAPSVARRH